MRGTMHIERTRFLVLAATIAASGCGRTGPIEAPPPREDESVEPPVIEIDAVDEEVLVAEPVETRDPVQEPVGPSADELAIVESHQRAAPSKLAAECRGIRPPPGPYCESIYDTTQSCELYEQTMIAEAATKATACLTRKSGTRAVCTFNIAASCFLTGARAAPKHVDATRGCAGPMKRCGGNRYRDPDMTAANCVAAVSAVQDRLRPKLISCIAEGCGVGSCLYYLNP